VKREDGRSEKSIRPVKILRNYLKYPEGSVLIEMGNTKVICTASVAENVPFHKKGSGSGWVTAEYAMLPRATTERTSREHAHGRARGRTQEIQRLIGRSLRAVTDMDKLGERSIYIDADVIQADGGTRTAAITGSWVALKDAISYLLKQRTIAKDPVSENLAAVSVGIVNGVPMLDLAYSEDVAAEVDMNIVMTESGKFVEVQGTAES
jgi:ribonuclease PH